MDGLNAEAADSPGCWLMMPEKGVQPRIAFRCFPIIYFYILKRTIAYSVIRKIRNLSLPRSVCAFEARRYFHNAFPNENGVS